MPRAEVEAYEASLQPDGSHDFATYKAEYERRLAERHRKLEMDARATFRAMDGWQTFESLDEWRATIDRATDEYDRGVFLLERLGAERYLDPLLMAVLLTLRRRLVEEHGATTAAELMLIDLVVLSYYHTLRINGWIGDVASLVEAEFFQKEGPSAKFQDRYGRGSHRMNGLRVEEGLERIAEQLLPLLDRCNRMMLRNLKALLAMREPPVPSVSIASAGQVNVAAQQVNGAGVQEPDAGRPRRWRTTL